jgi:hypothetical protein
MIEILIIAIAIGMIIYGLSITGTDKDKVFYLIPPRNPQSATTNKKNYTLFLLPVLLISSMIFILSRLIGFDRPIKVIAILIFTLLLAYALQLYVNKRTQ